MGKPPRDAGQTPSQLSAGIYRYDGARGFFVGDVELPVGPQVSQLLAAVMQGNGELVSFDAIKAAVQSTSDDVTNVFAVQFQRAKKACEQLGVAFPISTVYNKGRYWTGPSVSPGIERSSGATVRTYSPSDALADYLTKLYIVDAWASGPMPTEPQWGYLTMTPSGWIVSGGNFPAGNSLFWGHDHKLGAMAAARGRTVGYGVTLLGWEMLVQSSQSPNAALVNSPDDRTLQFEFENEESPSVIVEKLELYLLSILKTRLPTNPHLRCIEQALKLKPKTVPAIADFAGLSASELDNVCRSLQIKPSRLLRLHRFQSVMKRLSTSTATHRYTEVRPDYCDRVHLNRDFLDFMTISASLYFKTLQHDGEILDLIEIASGAAFWGDPQSGHS